MNKKNKEETNVVHGNEKSVWPQNKPAVMPIYLTSTWTDTPEGMADAFQGKNEHMIYARCGDPNSNLLASQICALDNGANAMVFGAGMSAVSGTVITLAKAWPQKNKSGRHNIVSASTVYGGTYECFSKTMPMFFNIHPRFIKNEKLDDGDYIESLIDEETIALYAEAIGNPTLKVINIKKYAEIAHKHNLPLIIDNTFSSEILKPFELGADIIIYSTTKYLNGHGTALGGSITVNEKYKDLLPLVHGHCTMFLGMVPNPMGSFLTTLGIEDHHLRMRAHSDNALNIANHLEKNPKIQKVNYPFLKSDPNYELAKKQMTGGGGMIAFEIKGSIEDVRSFITNLKLVKNCVSLGKVKTTLQHPAGGTHSHLSPEQQQEAGISPTLVRLSVGLENWEDIIKDIEQALK